MKLSKLKDRKAISPVIATIILVAVAITVSIAVAYWMGGIAGQYTKFEKVEIQSGYSVIVPTSGGWIITLELKNSGSATANLIKVFVNDKPVDVYATTSTLFDFAGTTNALKTGTNIPATGLAIDSGKTADTDTITAGVQPVEVYIGKSLFSSGTTIDIKIHSAGGMDYIKLLGLV
jgi:flagellin-like protein